jgi:NADH-quinone oxidoreductase subunit A
VQTEVLPILLLGGAVVALAVGLLVVANLFNPGRPGRVKRMPYESGMDPIHDTRRRFDVRYYLIAIAFLVFDVELLFLYPWAVVFSPRSPEMAPVVSASPVVAATPTIEAATPSLPARVERPPLIFPGGMVFLGLLVLGFVYDWKKGVFRWR